MAERNRSFLLVPAAGAGEGMGHLARCMKLAARLGPRVGFLTARMDSPARAFLAREMRHFPCHPRPVVFAKLDAAARWDIVLVDARRTTREELARLMRHGLVVCMDEGGEARDYAPFLVDALPGLPGGAGANLTSAAFLELPARRRRPVRGVPARALLSFGGEDKEGLSRKLAAGLLREKIFAPDQVTIVEGPLFASQQWPSGVAVVNGAAGLAQGLLTHDVLFTHFGMTAFEALASGVPVIMFNPTAYHERLAAAAGIPSLGMGMPDVKTLRRLLSDTAKLREPVVAFNRDVGRDRHRRLSGLLDSLRVRGSTNCPLCGTTASPAVARFPDRTYRRCPHCGITHLQSFAPEPKKYGKEYFSSEYRRQYGRTYLQDFAAIKTASQPRVRTIRELLPRDLRGVTVDVGCAYGPFLEVVKESGMPCFGIDISPGAVLHVRSRLRIPALCASFEKLERSALPRSIAAVTLWYVLEHFVDPDRALRKAASLLPVGGVLAFSTPNGRGISGLRSFSRFLMNSPADHFTIFSPRGMRKILEGYGLDLRRIRVTGHHPERFPGLIGRAAGRSAAARRVLSSISRLLRLGDTFEAYAVKGK
jgi:2-polyprenyl-3-methyl-5-hydroxy-6-metoxy-1,4-benzoquinol methylase